MRNTTLHTINLNSWIKTRNELTPLDGGFPPSMLKGEGVEFSFMMANHEDPELIKEALLEIVQELQNSIPDYAFEISKENKLRNFVESGDYQTPDVVDVILGMLDQEYTFSFKPNL